MNLPSDFVDYSRRLMGDDIYERLAKGLDDDCAPTSIRINPFKTDGWDVNNEISDGAVPWCRDTGRYLRQRPNFTFDPLLHAGAYYVQEAASMFVDYVVRCLIHEPVCMLDLCAAPGGKSTALRAALPEGSLLFSNEPMRTRAQILSENIQKFGHEDVIVSNNYPRDYRKAHLMFDAILADVPCSGEGMFRKDDGARAEWSLQNVDNCWHLQREIITDIWDCLRPGGLLIYSTCTFNAHEDEENVEWIASELGADIIELPTEETWNISSAMTGNACVYRFMPGISKSEGLFMAVLRKHGESESVAFDATTGASTKKSDKRKMKRDSAKKTSANTSLNKLNLPLLHPSDFCIHQKGDSVWAVPARWDGLFSVADASLKIIHAGIQIGTLKGKDIIPDESLALSRQLSTEAFPRVELTRTDAINFLRKEAVSLPEGTPRGFVVVTYKGMPIGFEKNIGARANNLYPQEWRIKSSHVPEEDTEIISLSNL